MIAAVSKPPATLPESRERRRQRLLRLLPPPRRWAVPLSLLPKVPRERLLERLMAVVLAQPLAIGDLDFLRDRRLGIEVADLGLSWVVTLRGGRLRADADEPAEATVSGSATDLLLLASRLEDADTLFFQRRLLLTGDTELGLTARNLLDRLPWESVPLGLRILLHRTARLAQAARAAHHGEA
jgi:O2-independent ubiquinone biosynthesis accessory factor UbiT